jgi:hypothetical protein
MFTLNTAATFLFVSSVLLLFGSGTIHLWYGGSLSLTRHLPILNVTVFLFSGSFGALLFDAAETFLFSRGSTSPLSFMFDGSSSALVHGTVDLHH